MHLKVFSGARVLVTGHTGFKGSWLSAWLLKLGAEVAGLSIGVPTVPSHFDAAGLGGRIKDMRADVADLDAMRKAIGSVRPDFVFHLAAQPLVRYSYANPVETYRTNVLGTAHLLESLRTLDKPVIAVLITSDKCYDNVEWVWGYRETDRLGGVDPYSASKGAAELVIRSYVKSFFPENGGRVRVGIGRAGNVIGGGDWAADRIVPDCIRAWANGESVLLRNPHATRPWQHVLEPLSGYLVLAENLARRPDLHGEPFNFGPAADQDFSVMALVKSMQSYWKGSEWTDGSAGVPGSHEAGLLKLNCDKALHMLDWKTALEFDETARMTVDWYHSYYSSGTKEMWSVTDGQIDKYAQLAAGRGVAWARQ